MKPERLVALRFLILPIMPLTPDQTRRKRSFLDLLLAKIAMPQII
ncbi:MAG: hypothetical protein JWO48_272 [Bryobacterales bacterium]|nr:hypothetical protein [Bryobacterales bacterium]